MKLVVITGCLGFIGSHLTKKCLDLGWKVYGIDSETYASNPDLIEVFCYEYGDNFTYIKRDIADLEYLPDCDNLRNTANRLCHRNSVAFRHCIRRA
jgi:nucleoside-diphosphate-sugar epimerase